MSKSTGGNAFDDVQDLNRSAKEYLVSAGRTALEIDKFKLSDEDKAKAVQLRDVIHRDVQDFSQKIEEVEKRHENWPARPKRPNHYHEALTVGNQYVELIDQITNSTMSTAMDLAEVLSHGVPVDAPQDQSAEQQEG
jgi:hypothetical protein